jgi:hypothetical protein
MWSRDDVVNVCAVAVVEITRRILRIRPSG